MVVEYFMSVAENKSHFIFICFYKNIFIIFFILNLIDSFFAIKNLN